MTDTERRARAKRGEGDALREEIIRVTEDLLLTTGDEAKVSMRAVARGCGCTPPAIYMHFADKDALILEVCARRFAEFGEFVAAAGARSDDPLESLGLQGRAYLEWGISNPEPYRVIFMTRSDFDPTVHGLEELPGMQAFMHLVNSVTACIDSGTFRRVDAFAAAVHIWTTMHGLTSALISHPNFPWPGTPSELAAEQAEVAVARFLA